MAVMSGCDKESFGSEGKDEGKLGCRQKQIYFSSDLSEAGTSDCIPVDQNVNPAREQGFCFGGRIGGAAQTTDGAVAQTDDPRFPPSIDHVRL